MSKVNTLLAAIVLAGLVSCTPAPTARVAVYSDSHAFTPATITVRANEPFVLEYTNDEEWAQHNIAVYTEPDGEALAVSESIVGPDAVTEVVVPALEAGTYHVQCDIHPFMTAELVVDGG